MHKPGLVVIDSLRAGHRLNENSPKVGDLIQEIDTIAAQLRVPILLVHHFRKKVNAKAPERVTEDEVRGSTTIVDRVQSLIALDEPDPDGARGHIRVSHVKRSDGRERPSLGMRWHEDAVDFDHEPPQPKGSTSIKSQVAALIEQILANGPQPSTVVEKLVEQAGFNYYTARKAKDTVGVEVKKQGKGWVWSLKK